MTLGRWLRDEIGPLTLAAARYSVASAVFVMILRRQPPESRRMGSDRWSLIGMAATGVVAFAPLLYLGLRHTTTINATLINALAPIITGVLAAFFIQEQMSRGQVVGAIAGLFGVFILVTGDTRKDGDAMRVNVGDLIVVATVVIWAAYSVLGRKTMQHRSPISTTALSALIGLPILILASIWEFGHFPVRLSPHLLLAVIYIGIGPTVLGYLAWNAGVQQLGAGGAMVFYNTLPLYGTVLGSIFLAESVSRAHLAGGALIIGGGLWAARKKIDSEEGFPSPELDL
jgi:drug/metabolite transporter (DMT)-like permease